MTYKQLLEWMAFYAVEPFDHHSIEIQTLVAHLAQIAVVLANINRDSKKKPTPFKLEEFVLKLDTDEEKKEQKPRSSKEIQLQQLSVVKLLMAAYGHDAGPQLNDILRQGVTNESV